jgi:hypothetical protein
VALVAAALVTAETGGARLLGIWPPDDNRRGWDRMIAIANEAGAGGLIALDLVTAFQNPDAFDNPIAHPPREDERLDDDDC